MKSILISINPQWCDLILNEKKTIEIRKTLPSISCPFKVYIYMTKSGKSFNESAHGKVIAEFICDEIYPIRVFENGSIQDYICNDLHRSCVPYDAIANYIGYDNVGYGWHISDLKVYENPKNLSEFYSYGYLDAKLKSIWYVDDSLWIVPRPPQSYLFVEDLDEVEKLIKKSRSNTTLSPKEQLIKEYRDINDPAEQLNYYRNLHYKDAADSESYIVAWALDKVLPELAQLRKEKEYGK